MGLFNVRPTGEYELDRVQYAIKQAFDSLANSLSQKTTLIGASLIPTGVTPGTFNNATLNVNALGQITTISGVNVPAKQVPWGDLGGSGKLASSGRFTWDDSLGLLTITNAGALIPAVTEGLRIYNAGSGGLIDLTQITSYVSASTTPTPSSAIVMGTSFTIATLNTVGGQFVVRGSSTGTVGGPIGLFVQTNDGDCFIGNHGVLSTSATKGFAHIVTTAGVPTGVPIHNASGTTDGIAVTIDKTNHRLYGYFPDNIWHYAAFDDGAAAGSAITALTGDVTATGPGSVAATISNSAVTYAKIQNVTNNRVLGNVSGSAHAPMELTATDVSTLLGLGTAATHAATDFLQVANNLSDLSSVSTARTNLGLGTAATHAATDFGPSTSKYIIQTADAALPNAQATGALATGLLKNTTTTGVLSIAVAGTDYQAPGNYITALTGDVTATGPGSVAATIANNAVTFAKMQTIADQRLIGNVSGSTAVPAALTAAQVSTFLYGNFTNKDVLYATGAQTIGQDSSFQYDHASTTLSVPVIVATTVEGDVGGANLLGLNNSSATDTAISLTSSEIDVKGSIIPTADATYDIGSNSHGIAHMHVGTIYGSDASGILSLNSEHTGTFQITLGPSEIDVKGSVIPVASLTYDLGSSSDLWTNVWTQTVSGAGTSALNLNSDAGVNPHSSIVLSNGGLTLRGYDVDIIFQAVSTTVFRVENSSKRLKFVQGNITAVTGANPVSIGSAAINAGSTMVLDEWLEVRDSAGATKYIALFRADS